MGTSLTKTEKTVAVIAFIAIAAFFFMFLQINQRSGAKISSQFEATAAINYKMARPDQIYSEYTLDGREVDQTYEALTPAEKKLSKRKQALLVKQKIENKKKEEIKKKQLAAARAQSQEKARAQIAAQKAQANKAHAANQNANTRSEQVADNYQNYDNAQAPVIAPLTDAKPATKKSFAEWRSLIFEKPTAETLGQFITAFRKNEVTATEYQAMAQDLLDQTDEKMKGLGLMALRSVPSLASLSQLVHIESSLSETYQAYVEQSLIAYFQPQNLAYLNQALGTRDKVLILKSLNLLSSNLQRLSQGDQSGFIDPRNRREDTTLLVMSNFAGLLPTLGQIGGSQDHELSGLAQQVIALIQSSNHLVQN